MERQCGKGKECQERMEEQRENEEMLLVLAL